MDKLTVIPKESSEDNEIFSKNVRNVESSDFFGEHIEATREYMNLRNIPISGKRYSDIGNVLLRGAVLMEESVIDALYIPISIDNRQHDFLISYLKQMESKNKMIAFHALYKGADNKYNFNAFSVSSSDEYEKARMVLGLRYLTYAVNSVNEDKKGKTAFR